MFVILQKYDFSSKSQQTFWTYFNLAGCLWYCKSTTFQANHNVFQMISWKFSDVCDTAKVRLFKQITTTNKCWIVGKGCLWYCKSTTFQANHNRFWRTDWAYWDVCDTAKVRLFKQITTNPFVLQCYKGCLWYCKSTTFQANHNKFSTFNATSADVCDTAKVRLFKQITTTPLEGCFGVGMFVILQKYDFSSKSQQFFKQACFLGRCLWYCKSTTFQANHNSSNCLKLLLRDVCDTAKVRLFKQITTMIRTNQRNVMMFVILQKYDFSSKSQLAVLSADSLTRCLWYCKSTTFQANHNASTANGRTRIDVCDTAKVRLFKQITTKTYIV